MKVIQALMQEIATMKGAENPRQLANMLGFKGSTVHDWWTGLAIPKDPAMRAKLYEIIAHPILEGNWTSEKRARGLSEMKVGSASHANQPECKAMPTKSSASEEIAQAYETLVPLLKQVALENLPLTAEQMRTATLCSIKLNPMLRQLILKAENPSLHELRTAIGTHNLTLLYHLVRCMVNEQMRKEVLSNPETLAFLMEGK